VEKFFYKKYQHVHYLNMIGVHPACVFTMLVIL
jgi:hypothetical protein